MRGRCLQSLRCLGLLLGLFWLLAGCGSGGGSSTPSGTAARGQQLYLQFLLSSQLMSPASSTTPRDGLVLAQARQVQPGDPGFIARLDIRLQAQGSELGPLQSFTLDPTEQDTATREVTVPDPAPETFEVLVSSLNSQGLEIFRGQA